MSQVLLKTGKARPFYARHPWVLDTAIDQLKGEPEDGDVVDLLSDKGKFIARGLYNSHSRIRVRLYSWDSTVALDADFWRHRLAQAFSFREQIGLDNPQGAARLLFSEGDAFSGLIIDRYADYLVLQVTALAMARRLPILIPMLVEMLHPKGILVRSEKGVKRAENMELEDGPYWGDAPESPIEILDQGLRYEVDLHQGQKTGFYLDQRDNRRAAAVYMKDRRVLDMFCYSGGFSLNASAFGEAKEVVAFDSSAKAVALGEANAARNGISNITFQCGDAFKSLEALAAEGRRFDAVILDPPKFANSRRAIEQALRAYHWLNRLGLSVLEPGGILVTCSCSGHVDRQDFVDMLVGVSQQTKRDIQILENRGPAADHPILTTCLEGDYLKCIIARVL